MKIGLITQWYEPEPGAAAHPTGIARALNRRGHDVRVLTGFPNYPTGRIYPDYKLRLRRAEFPDGISVLRVPLVPSHDDNAFHRVLGLSSFALSATMQVGHLRGVDVCLVYLTPATVGMAARLLRRLAGVPYVLYVQDLWPESVTESGFIKNRQIQAGAERLTHLFLRGLYKNAAYSAAIAPTMAEMLHERGVPRDRCAVVYNWVDEAVFQPPTSVFPSDELPRDLTWVMYAGGVGSLQALDKAVEAVRRLERRRDIGLVIVGDGVALPSLREQVDRLGLQHRVRFLGRRPMSEIPSLMAAAGAQLVSLADRPIFRATVPSKLQSSMAAGQPVVCAVSGDAAELVTSSGAGVVARPEDPESLAQAFKEMADAGPAERAAMGRRAREFYLKELSESVGVQRLENLLAHAVAERVR